MNNFPAFLKLRNQPVLLVGGGAAALAKARLLAAAGARLRVVAPEIDPVFESLHGQMTLIPRAFHGSDLSGVALVFSATGDAGMDGHVAARAVAQNIPVNVVDRPELCTFLIPSIVNRGSVTVAISSDGASPVLTRRLREQIERLLPANLDRLADFLGSFRAAVRAKVGGFDARRRLWEEVIDGPIGRDVLAGRESTAREAMLSRINRSSEQKPAHGYVAIVGAGPGDPDLLTVKALRALQDADVVVHDRLVGDGVLDLIRRDAARVYVGKQKSNHSVPQAEINELLVSLARQGKRVVRLKGGDPFVFGRGGEEIDALRAAGIEVSVVPGITAATGCAASLGMPLTHRDCASAVTFVTGHGVGGDPDIDWSALVAPRHTLVVYMGLSRAGALAESLIRAGRAPGTPVAIVENGTRVDERVVTGTLSSLPSLVTAARVGAPALIVVGEVAALAEAARDVAVRAAAQAV
jgi:uroporphyrin-III C-methyltransferase/precorrin-2 dehydrogenase/sirohydrochlorin ferrochelatase